MYTYKHSNFEGVSQECPNAYTYDKILEKYRQGNGSYGMSDLLHGGYIRNQGWTYCFRDKGELKRYLYWSSAGTGLAYAPNVKLLEKNLHHKIYKAVSVS